MKRAWLLLLLLTVSARSEEMWSLGARVRVRQSPDLKAPVLGFLLRGERVQVIQMSTFTQTINGETDEWFRVVTKKEMEGWVFGAFLEVENAAGPPKRLKTQILFPGDFHAGEVPFDAAGPWWAVCGDMLAAAAVSTEAFKDISDDDDAATGVRVKAAGACAEPQFLVRNLAGAKARPIETGPILESVDRQTVQLEFNKDMYAIERRPRGETGYEVVLRQFDRRHVLYATDTADDAGWSLRWFGDLDGDGKADFLIDASHHYNVSQSWLFLSGGAGGDVVRLAAFLRRVGC